MMKKWHRFKGDPYLAGSLIMSSSGPSPVCSIYLIWGHPEEGLQHVGPGLGFEDSQMSSQRTFTVQDSVKWPLLQELQFGKSKSLSRALFKKFRMKIVNEPYCGCWGRRYKFRKLKLLIEHTNMFNFSLIVSDYKWKKKIFLLASGRLTPGWLRGKTSLI